jgi:hypothetical protein
MMTMDFRISDARSALQMAHGFARDALRPHGARCKENMRLITARRLLDDS